MRAWHNVSGRFVYAADGLRLDDVASPCAGSSRWRAASADCAGALVLAKILADGSGADSVAAFGELFATSKLVHVSTIDLAVLSTFAFEPIREDMARRGWWDEGSPTDAQRNRLLAFCAVPVLGPSLYVALRPPLQE